MHMGIGEEAIMAGTISHLVSGDALALDHRGSSAALLWGIDPLQLVLEFMGDPDGLCGGNGGHMHLFSREHLLASSGIVGSSTPAAVGFALKMDHDNSQNIAVAFFGEGAMNEGIVMESFNLAAIWDLPVLFVCKDSELAITTRSEQVTAGSLLDRATAFGVEGVEIDGTDALAVWEVVKDVTGKIRSTSRPAVIHAHCEHPTGHFLGDPLHHSLNLETIGPLIKASVRRKGSNPLRRIASMLNIVDIMRRSMGQRRGGKILSSLRDELKSDRDRQKIIEQDVEEEMDQLLTTITAKRGSDQ